MINITAKQTYRIVYFILSKGRFSQLEIHKKLKVSLARINEVIQWLLIERHAIEKIKRGYKVIDYPGIIALFPLFRSMDRLAITKMGLTLTTKQVLEKLPKEAVLCLESALSQYSNYYRSNKVGVYAEPNSKTFKKIENTFKQYAGGETQLLIFKPDFKPEAKKIKRIVATEELRTLIDLACDNKTHYAKDIFKLLWGIEIEE